MTLTVIAAVGALLTGRLQTLSASSEAESPDHDLPAANVTLTRGTAEVCRTGVWSRVETRTNENTYLTLRVGAFLRTGPKSEAMLRLDDTPLLPLLVTENTEVGLIEIKPLRKGGVTHWRIVLELKKGRIFGHKLGADEYDFEVKFPKGVMRVPDRGAFGLAADGSLGVWRGEAVLFANQGWGPRKVPVSDFQQYVPGEGIREMTENESSAPEWDAVLGSPPLTASPGSEEWPSFPWPPPAGCTRVAIPDDFLRKPGTNLLGDVDRSLSRALDCAGYSEKSYYSIPSGFALVTRLEQTDEEGNPKPGVDRWAAEVSRMSRFSLSAYLKALFTSTRGHFRIMVLAFTDEAFAATGQPITRDEAVAWLGEGLNKLPAAIAALEYTAGHSCTALVYEFETGASGAVLHDPARVPAKNHLERASMWPCLASPQ